MAVATDIREKVAVVTDIRENVAVVTDIRKNVAVVRYQKNSREKVAVVT